MLETLRAQLGPALHDLIRTRAAELREFADLAHAAAASGKVPDLAAVPREVLVTGCAATSAVLLLILPRPRRLLTNTLDTVLASILLVLLIAVLVSLPLCTLYISYRGLLFLAASLSESYPIVAKLLPQIPPAA